MVELLRPKRIVAIGNDAEKAAKRFHGQCEVYKVRHPSYGGKNVFMDQVLVVPQEIFTSEGFVAHKATKVFGFFMQRTLV